MSEQSLKRKSESDLYNTISSKRTTRDNYHDSKNENVVDILEQEKYRENKEEEEDEEEIEEEDVGIESENFEYSEVEDEFSDEDELNSTTVDLSNDNYLSFSENEITGEGEDNSLSKRSAYKDVQPKIKKKRKKKNPNMRKNIRNVLAEKHLDSATQKLREKELERLKRLGYATSPILPSAGITTSSTTKSTKKKLSTSDVICLSSSDEETTDPVIKHSNNTKKKEVFVLSSDSDDADAVDEENLADHHSDLGMPF